MAQILVSSTTLLSSNHVQMHNVYTIDQNAPTGAVYISGTTGYMMIGGGTTPTAPLQILTLVSYTNNNQALANGLTVGALYRNGDNVAVVH